MRVLDEYNGESLQISTQERKKLKAYKLIKNDYKMETYLYHISDRKVRRYLTKLRCSNHTSSD